MDLEMPDMPNTETNNEINAEFEPDSDIENKNDKREIGNLATWTVSSSKPGFGVEQLRNDSIDTFWQSDGPQPHYINIHFIKKVSIKLLSFYTQYRQDESYTPSKISVRAGTGFHDLQEVIALDLNEPSGWVHVTLGDCGKDGLLRTHLLQLCVQANHQNGKDTHIRLVKVFAPRIYAADEIDILPYTSIAFSKHLKVR
ncbi:hypothetical protein PMAC_000071 [Pneumocystis sp. 'macacae']|nr:hypothetical protein PMAC_000071 [Pneumocystis sp. 'macacae']